MLSRRFALFTKARWGAVTAFLWGQRLCCEGNAQNKYPVRGATASCEEQPSFQANCLCTWNWWYTTECTWMCIILKFRLKFHTTSRVSIITLWICWNFHVFKISSPGSRKILTGHRIAIRVLKQNSRTVWFKVQYPHSVIWNPIENPLNLYKKKLLKLSKTCL